MTAHDWTETAVRMQRRAELAAFLHRGREASSYLRRRNYCAQKAMELGGKPWSAICKAIGEVELRGAS